MINVGEYTDAMGFSGLCPTFIEVNETFEFFPGEIGIYPLIRWCHPEKDIKEGHLSNEKNCWLFRVYRGLYYPVVWGV